MKKKKEVRRRNNIPTVDELDDRFIFVKNEVLRKNLAINMQYIIFLIQEEELNTLPGPITYSIFKNIILYTTSIIEGVLTYTFKTGIDLGLIDESKVMKKDTKFKNVKEIYKIDERVQVVSGLREKNFEKFNFRRTSFYDVIKSSKKATLIDADLVSKIDSLREKRNKIHLASLELVDDYYDKKEVNDAFVLATEVLEACEKYLKEKRPNKS